jgi:hypothetical protein
MKRRLDELGVRTLVMLVKETHTPYAENDWELIREVLMKFLLLDPAAADANACRLEHALDAAGHQRLREAVSLAAARPQLAASWRRALRARLKAGGRGQGSA